MGRTNKGYVSKKKVFKGTPRHIVRKMRQEEEAAKLSGKSDLSSPTTVTSSSTMENAYGKETSEEFSARLCGYLNGGLTSLSIALGVKSGLFDVLVEHHNTPLTSQEVAEKAGMKERYVREWLGAMATAHIVLLNPETERYHLPAHRLDVLRTGTAQNQVALGFKAVPFLAEVFKDMLEVIKKDGPLGLSHEKADSFTEFEEDTTKLWYEQQFNQQFIPSIPGLTQKLDRGMRMLDVGCGRGAGTRILAEQYPKSNFVGIDVGESPIRIARDLARPKALNNVEYHCMDASVMPREWSDSFDYVFFYNVLHDVPRPDTILAEVKRVLKPGGLMSVLEINAHSKQADNIGATAGAELYTISLFHCLPASFNVPGSLGLGTAWGREAVEEYLKEHGFVIESVVEEPKLHFLCSVPPQGEKN